MELLSQALSRIFAEFREINTSTSTWLRQHPKDQRGWRCPAPGRGVAGDSDAAEQIGPKHQARWPPCGEDDEGEPKVSVRPVVTFSAHMGV